MEGLVTYGGPQCLTKDEVPKEIAVSASNPFGVHAVVRLGKTVFRTLPEGGAASVVVRGFCTLGVGYFSGAIGPLGAYQTARENAEEHMSADGVVSSVLEFTPFNGYGSIVEGIRNGCIEITRNVAAPLIPTLSAPPPPPPPRPPGGGPPARRPRARGPPPPPPHPQPLRLRRRGRRRPALRRRPHLHRPHHQQVRQGRDQPLLEHQQEVPHPRADRRLRLLALPVHHLLQALPHRHRRPQRHQHPREDPPHHRRGL